MLGYKLPRPLPVPELSQLLGLELWMVLPYGQNVGCLFALLLLGLFWWGQRDRDFPFPSLYETCSSGRLSPSKFSAFKSNLVSACAPLRTAATRTRCCCLAAPMLVTGRQVMAGGHGGCGAQQVFSGAPFHCQLWFHSSAELREAGLSVVGGLSQPFPWPIYSQSLTARGTRDKCWKPGSSLSTAPSACSTTTSKVCWKAGRGGKKNKIRLSPFVKLCLSKH